MIVAYVASGRVVSVSTVPADAEIPDGWHEVPDGLAVEPGWWLVDGTWLAPEPRRVAIVVDGIVTQIVGLDASDPDRPPGAVLLEDGSPAAPGWHYAAGTFVPPVLGPAAIVTDGVVTNLIRVDVDAPPALDGLVLVPDGVAVAIGYGHADGVFSPPVVALADLKAAKLAALDAACAAAIVGGFESDALGAPHTYPSKAPDQTNLMGSVVAAMLPGLPGGWTTPFWCADGAAEWAFRDHTAAQIIAAGVDGKTHVVTCQARLASLAAEVATAPDAAAVAAISW